jgi:hypothetical protein
LSAHAQQQPRTHVEQFDDLTKAGYPIVKTLSFAENQIGHISLTALYKSESDTRPLVFSAHVSPTKEGGAVVGFIAYSSCTLTQQIHETFVEVDGQKARATTFCAPTTEISDTADAFAIDTVEGTAYAMSEFTSKNYVSVRLNGIEVPFRTDGFAETLADQRKTL